MAVVVIDSVCIFTVGLGHSKIDARSFEKQFEDVVSFVVTLTAVGIPSDFDPFVDNQLNWKGPADFHVLRDDGKRNILRDGAVLLATVL
ncbi:hypothetical protein pdam_00001921 [Pocillopora damicornis]|uniref:Uncharacterized protein n=1 Tax=Pocillopora damicornis TaxID=46731 RepID=A0A3M6TQ27_POCDA|nr:hypothetical protein pdam_00001921 [Pocillopora damicornis]